VVVVVVVVDVVLVVRCTLPVNLPLYGDIDVFRLAKLILVPTSDITSTLKGHQIWDHMPVSG